MIFNNNMEHFEEDNEIILENYILREKNFIIKSDKKNEFNAKLFITTNNLFCLNLVTTNNFQTTKYSLSLTMNELKKIDFLKFLLI